MNVAAVQKHLSDLTEFLRSAGATAPILNGLTAVRDGLAPFAEYKVEQFAAFLKLVDEYRRAGVEPDKVPRRSTGATRRSSTPAPSAEEVKARIDRLYRDILNPNLAAETIDQELQLLDKLKKADLQAVANAVGIGGKVQKLKNDLMAAAIKQAIKDRRGMFHRPTY